MPEGLNAAQLQQTLRGVAIGLQLKQWCVERAISAGAADTVGLARAIYGFLTEDLKTDEPGEAS